MWIYVTRVVYSLRVCHVCEAVTPHMSLSAKLTFAVWKYFSCSTSIKHFALAEGAPWIRHTILSLKANIPRVQSNIRGHPSTDAFSVAHFERVAKQQDDTVLTKVPRERTLYKHKHQNKTAYFAKLSVLSVLFESVFCQFGINEVYLYSRNALGAQRTPIEMTPSDT